MWEEGDTESRAQRKRLSSGVRQERERGLEMSFRNIFVREVFNRGNISFTK